MTVDDNTIPEGWHRHSNGGGLVQNTAEVADTAYVGPNAKVYDNAVVCGNAKIYGNAQVFEKAIVCDNAKVFEKALIYGNAQVFENATVCGSARVYDNAVVCGNVQVYGNRNVHREARVYNSTQLFEWTKTKNITLDNSVETSNSSKVFKETGKKENHIESLKLVIDSLRTPKVSIGMDDLWMLVQFAVKHEEITLSRAAELTGVPLQVWRNSHPIELDKEDILLPNETNYNKKE